MSTAYETYLERMAEIRSLNSALSLLSWDQETFMPSAGLDARAEARATLSGLVHDRTVAPVFGDLLVELAATDLDADQAVNVRETIRDRDRSVKIPRELVTELTRTTSLAQRAWMKARETNDWPVFAPLLDRVLELRRKQAEAVGYETEPYDALLDEFEPGARVAEVARVFAELRAEIVPLAEAIHDAGPRDDALMRRTYPMAAQQALGLRVLETMGFDFDAGRLDASAHPFTSGIGANDIRLTTHYDESDLAISLYSSMHEGGHGLYEQGLPAEQAGLPRGEAVSLGIHESQSRLWENQVGRSREFGAWLMPLLRKSFPGVLDDVDSEDLYRAVNIVRPSTIRIEADEITYNLHIILRMELERAMVRGEIAVNDLPGLWNERMTSDLGVTPRDDTEGVLQDIHWSFGLFGYFPTYTLGNIYSAQLYQAAAEDLGDLPGRMSRGELAPLLGWMREKIHIHGRSLTADELCRRATGNTLDSGPFVAYLRSKFTDLYQLDLGVPRA